jgi:Orsellinic acid/F9775 biosynthesis cluster protein D
MRIRPPPRPKSTRSVHSSRVKQQQTCPVEVPTALSQLVALNVEYGVLLCVGSGCCKAVSPASIVEHLRTIRQTSRAIRRQVQVYVQAFPAWDYDYASVPLPLDGLAPQPVVPVVDGFQCRHCSFCSQSRKRVKVHGNKVHSIKRVADDELFQPVKLQSWFRDGKERYWVWMRASKLPKSARPAEPQLGSR